MFPRWQRLSEKRVYTRIFRDGARIKNSELNLIVLPATTGGKIGFIVSKKVAKSAVERNRLKRRLRAAFLRALRQEAFRGLLNRYYIVVMVQRNVSDMPFDPLTQLVETSLSRLSSLTFRPRPRHGRQGAR